MGILRTIYRKDLARSGTTGDDWHSTGRSFGGRRRGMILKRVGLGLLVVLDAFARLAELYL